eukprot:GHVO01021410.1.p1 GENE.GHVO01021410.1~~GHVO01021410.1.p1  ORF type:complete len:168 (+),score=16.58 GHVO01021410.1:419-922(+)
MKEPEELFEYLNNVPSDYEKIPSMFKTSTKINGQISSSIFIKMETVDGTYKKYALLDTGANRTIINLPYKVPTVPVDIQPFMSPTIPTRIAVSSIPFRIMDRYLIDIIPIVTTNAPFAVFGTDALLGLPKPQTDAIFNAVTICPFLSWDIEKPAFLTGALKAAMRLP